MGHHVRVPRSTQPDIPGPNAFLSALRETSRNLREQFKDDPEGLALKLGLMLPEKPATVMKGLGLWDEETDGPIEPGMREFVLDVCNGEVESAVAVGPRGGGKSQGVSFTEFFLVFVKDYDALNLGGSELQAEQVYRYLVGYIDSDNYWRTLLKGDTLQSKTETQEDAWIRVLAASSKSVRSPHAGGRKPGGRMAGAILVIDEEAEADESIVEAALFTINTATPSVSARCSTFHNAEGSFATLIDNHKEMGYKLYKWDIFDVCSGCECGPDGCESEEKCFREDHFETVIDPETGEVEEKLLHKAYCGGRARYARGWVPIGEIVKTWTRLNRNHDRFEVEAMGSRPSTKGFVIKDQNKFAENFVNDKGRELYLPGGPVTICVDWGTVAAGVSVWQEQFGGRVVLIHAEELHESGESAILGKIVSLWDLYPDAFEVAADIGGGGNYLNKKLREEMGIPCRDVNFATEKESAAAAWNILNEGEKCVYPSEFEDFKKQGRKWKRDKGGRIKKGNDHIMDSALCFFSKFIDELGVSNIRVPPRSFHAQANDDRGSMADHVEQFTPSMVRPVVVGIGKRRR